MGQINWGVIGGLIGALVVIYLLNQQQKKKK